MGCNRGRSEDPRLTRVAAATDRIWEREQRLIDSQAMPRPYCPKHRGTRGIDGKGGACEYAPMRLGLLLLAAAMVSRAAAQEDELVPFPYLADRYTAPTDAPSTALLAARDEPGERLVVSGRVLFGSEPVPGASLFVFQTDRNGVYAPGVNGNDAELTPRLYALLRTDSEGRYRYETIRQGSYNGNAAHVHYIVKATGYKARIVDLWFQDDPILAARRAAGLPEVTDALRNTPYYRASAEVIAIRPVARDVDGTWHTTRDIQMFRKSPGAPAPWSRQLAVAKATGLRTTAVASVASVALAGAPPTVVTAEGTSGNGEPHMREGMFGRDGDSCARQDAMGRPGFGSNVVIAVGDAPVLSLETLGNGKAGT